MGYNSALCKPLTAVLHILQTIIKPRFQVLQMWQCSNEASHNGRETGLIEVKAGDHKLHMLQLHYCNNTAQINITVSSKAIYFNPLMGIY